MTAAHPRGDKANRQEDHAPDDRLRPRLAIDEDLPAINRVIADAYSLYLDRMDRPPAPMVTDYGLAISRCQVWVLGKPIIGVVVLVQEAERRRSRPASTGCARIPMRS